MIENPQPSAKKQREMAAAKYGTSHKEQLRQTIDRVLPGCKDYEDFLAKMRAEGYEIKEGKVLSFRTPGWDRFTRSNKLGVNYSREALRERSSNRGGHSDTAKKAIPYTGRNVNLLIDTAEKLGVSPRSIEQKIQVAKKLTSKVKGIVKEHDIGFKNALKLSRLSPEQQEEAAAQLAAGTIHSADEYRPIPKGAVPPPDEGEEAPPEAPAIASGAGCYPTIRDSVADLKNPDKDRSRTPDTFLASFSFFLQRFRQGVENYTSPEYAVVFPALTREQLEQLRQEVNSACAALHNLFHKMERKSRK